MRFRSLVRMVFLTSLLSASLDIAITELGYARFPPELEANPYINLLALWLAPPLAAAVLFVLTVILTALPYRMIQPVFSDLPYSGSLRDVWLYLWESGSFRARDGLVFVSLIAYGVFVHLHLTGFISWLRFFAQA